MHELSLCEYCGDSLTNFLVRIFLSPKKIKNVCLYSYEEATFPGFFPCNRKTVSTTSQKHLFLTKSWPNTLMFPSKPSSFII